METQGKTKDLMQKFGNIGHVVYKTKEGDFEIYCRLSAESVLITAHEVPQLVEFLLDGLSIEDKSKIISKPKTYSEKLAQVKIGDVLIRAVPDENGRNYANSKAKASEGEQSKMNKSIVQMVLDGDPQGQDFTPVQISTYDKLKAYRTSVLLGESESLELLEELFDMAFEAGKSSFVVTTKDAQRMIDDVVIPYVNQTADTPIGPFLMEGIADKITGWLRTL